jgi:hypothetical protein
MERSRIVREKKTAVGQLAELLEKTKVKFTFSKNCCSGIVHILGEDMRCQCRRCRQERGEPVTEETEQQAAALSAEARAKYQEVQRKWIKDNPLRSRNGSKSR